MARIVVGIDASHHCVRALGWALDEARLRNADVELVYAYPHADYVDLPTVVLLSSGQQLQEAGEAILDEALASAGNAQGVSVVRTVRLGGAAQALCEAAQDADLLVVGARGLGGFRGLLLGSVSHQVVTHSRCPVVVVTGEDR